MNELIRIQPSAWGVRTALMLAILVGQWALAAQTVTYTSSGSWTAPTGVSSVTVEAWGGGGGGGAATGNPAKGGGGAGGQYVRKVVSVVAGNTYAFTVGNGGSAGTSVAGGAGGDSTFAGTTVVAKGGAGGGLAAANNSGGVGGVGSASGGIGDVVYAGGSGSSGVAGSSCQPGGAGGGGAGSSGPGGDADGNVGGSGTSEHGGNGGNGKTVAGAGDVGSAAGGGGAGGCATTNADHAGGAGGRGQLRLTYEQIPYVLSINRVSFNPTTSNTVVAWSVTFNLPVTGVDAGDFTLTQAGGAAGASITGVSGSGTAWTVTANTGHGTSGTLHLNLIDNDSIVGADAALGGLGVGNGNFTTGQSYTILPPVCDGSADIIFCDDFERSNPGQVGNGWTVTPANITNCTGTAGNTGCAGIDSDIPPFNNYANPRANSTRAMFTRWSRVTVESPTINLAGKPGAQLSFWVRRGHDGFSEDPEGSGENYLVQYYASDNTWKILAQYPACQPDPLCDEAIFLPVIELPVDALHANFRLRFYQPTGSGKSGSGGAPGVVGYDYWHMDNVIVREKTGPSYVGAFCDNFEGGLGRWSTSAENAPASATIGDARAMTLTALSPANSLALRWGYVVASTFKTDLRGVTGNITYWVRSGTTSSNDNLDPDSGENLVVEYLDSAGVWRELATYPGTATGGATYNASHPIPADARHANFRLRFRMLAGSGYDLDYWHVDDVCVGDPLPTANLALSKTGSPTLVPGTSTNYTLTATNLGPGTLSGSLEIVDTLPGGISYLGSSGSGWSCGAVGQIVTCNWSGTLTVGAAAPVLTLIAMVGSSASGSLTNTATLTGTVADPATGNNTATYTGVVFSPAYVFTDSACIKGLAFDNPAQTCRRVSWDGQVAGKPLTGIYVTAVGSDGVPKELSASSSTTISLQFGLTCHDPVANAGVQATFSAVAAALPLGASNGAVPTSWSSGVNVVFAANAPSVGPYRFNYNDVGKVELYVRNSAVTTQIGSSGAFVVKPYGFKLALNCAHNFSTASATSPVYTFCPAGETVSGTVTAVRYDSSATNNLGVATPNFGKETTVQTVGLAPNLVGPTVAVGGTATAFASFTMVDSNGNGKWDNGEGLSFNWPEVGTIKFTPTLNYLGAGDIASDGKTSSEDFVGPRRFYPYRMALANNGSQEGAPGDDLTYVGQPFHLGFTLTAENKAGVAVKNYGLPGYGQRSSGAALSIAAENADDGNPLGSHIKTHPGGATPSFTLNWPAAAGAGAVASVAVADYRYQRSNPLAPLDALKIGMRFVDDSVDRVPLRNGNMNQATAGNCLPASCDALSLIDTRMRFGRLHLVNAYGSELLPLRVEGRVEYWDGSRWLLNAIDSTTSIAQNGVTKAGPLAGSVCFLNNPPPSAPTAANCLPATGGSGSPVTTMNGGKAQWIVFSNRAVGYADLSVDLTGMPWLLGRWSGAATAFNENPVARARFGSARAPFIYLRERY